MPVIFSCAPAGLLRMFCKSDASFRCKTSSTRVLLPLPETPVTTLNSPTGKPTVIFFRL